jgi:hypothetical protein
MSNMLNTNNQQNVYSSTPSNFDMVSQLETSRMSRNTQDSFNATQTNVIPTMGFNQKILNESNNNTLDNQGSNYRDKNFFNVQKPQQKYVSQLTGTTIEKFEHTNMQPFFKKNPHTAMDRSEVILEKYQGSGGTTFRKKQEVKNMFENTTGMSHINGTPALTNESIMENRFVQSRYNTSNLPFTQQRVGPGIGEGFTSAPSGGYNQASTRDYIIPKSVDNLRTKNNPKLSYEARIVAGLKSTSRGLVSKPKKHKVDKYYVNNQGRYFRTGGDIRAASMREKYHFKPTHKNHREYTGAAKQETTKPMKHAGVRNSRKNNYMNQSPRNLDANDSWQLTEENMKNGLSDFGKKSIENKPNERDITQKRTILSNMSVEIKKAIVPIIDIFKKTRKENFIGNIRPDGNMSADMPAKLTVYDSNDIARTTIKETNIHDNRLGNLKGAVKNQVKDYEDVARTTIKETNIHNSSPNINMSPQQPKSLRVYDPEDIPQTTIKETNIDNAHGGFLQSPNADKTGSYNTSRYKAKNTNRQFLNDYEYSGNADNNVGKGGGRGYLTARYNAKNTNKQFTSVFEYKGSGKDYNNRAMSYSDKYNANMNDNKEKTLRSRNPTKEGVKLNSGSDRFNTQVKKLNADIINTREPSEQYIYNVPPTKNSCGLTQIKDKLTENTQRSRMDPNDLEAFKKNPYTQSLASAF